MLRRRASGRPAEAPAPEAPQPAPVDPNLQVLTIDYPVHPRRRPGFLPHPGLEALMERGREHYRGVVKVVLDLVDDLARIPTHPDGTDAPAWVNGWLPGLDAAVLYATLTTENPRTYIEVGSGNSTKFARRAIRDHDLRTTIVSIDPYPRAEVDRLCDEVVRQPLEDADLAVFDRLAPGDVVFVDGSHRVFTNSDTTVALLEVLPKVPPGCFFEVHDIWLPYDYPPDWDGRWYNEQYLLAAWILADGPHVRTHFPGWFVSLDPELSEMLAPLWEQPALREAEHQGLSYWLRTGPIGE